MSLTRIDLSRPFEEFVAAVLSLPKAPARDTDTPALRRLLRGLYEAANGRQVDTTLGLLPIAPPVAPFLKEAPFEVKTQLDFLVQAMSRVIACPSGVVDVASLAQRISSESDEFARADANLAMEKPEIFPRPMPAKNRVQLPAQGVSHG